MFALAGAAVTLVAGIYVNLEGDEFHAAWLFILALVILCLNAVIPVSGDK
jgi:hypothetical protein